MRRDIVQRFLAMFSVKYHSTKMPSEQVNTVNPDMFKVIKNNALGCDGFSHKISQQKQKKRASIELM